MKKMIDFLLAVGACLIFLLPGLVVAIAVALTSPGPVFYWSNRLGRDHQIFNMPKFRTMRVDTPVVATALLPEPHNYITPIGSFLRKTSLDELPQLWSILKGDMSFVGPRPALPSEVNLITLRLECGVHALTPGLTGWAQVNGRDVLSVAEKVRYDQEYLQRHSFFFDMKILCLTFFRVAHRSGVSH